MDLLIKNIKKLVQIEESPRSFVSGKDMASLASLDNAYLHIHNDLIAGYGPMPNMPQIQGSKIIDATERLVFPSFCDSHTHLIYAGSREIEYIDKIRGLSYEEIAKRGGGILNSAERLRKASEDELFDSAMERVREIISLGTGAVEIKSGYGLNLESEIKMLRVAQRIKKVSPITVKTTFLGAHAVPAGYKGRQSEYVKYIVEEMIPRVTDDNLADFIDVFCDRGFFTVDETSQMLEAAANYGIRPKIHANELAMSGGVQVGVAHNALSVDHLEFVGDEEIACLRNSSTMPTLLPGAAFFLGMKYAPARLMIDAGLPVALASDYNPGSSPSGDMKFVVSLACIKLKMLPEEAINATTINSAYAMGLSNSLGSISKGKKANVFITKPIPSYEFMPYAYTQKLVDTVILNGNVVEQ